MVTGATTTEVTTAAPSAMSGSARSGLLRSGTVAAVAAAAATTAVAAIARGADVSLAVDGEQIPLGAFAFMTALWALAGVAMAAGMARLAPRPRTLFARTTIALTALSCISPCSQTRTPRRK